METRKIGEKSATIGKALNYEGIFFPKLFVQNWIFGGFSFLDVAADVIEFRSNVKNVTCVA